MSDFVSNVFGVDEDENFVFFVFYDFFYVFDYVVVFFYFVYDFDNLSDVVVSR